MSAAKGNPTNPWLVLVTVMVGTLLIGLDRTVVNLAVPSIISDFGISVSTAAWVATGYIISNAVFVPVFGKLGDLFGNRIIYLWSFVGFIVISMFAGFAWNFDSLIVLRVLQGLVGAAVYPTAMSLIAKSFTDPKARAQALGIWASSFAISSVIGPLIGGYLVDNLSWRWVFFINLPIGIAGLLMTMAFIAHDRPGERGAFDWPGAVFLAGAISPLVLILDRGQDWGWGSTGAWICYLSAIIFGLLTYFWETRQAHPIIDFKFFKNPSIVSILTISFVSFGGLMGAMFLLPVFTQTFLGYDATQSGLLFIPMGLALPIAAPLGGRLSSRIPMRYIVGTGMMLSAIGLFMLRNLDPGMGMADFILPLITFGAGLGLGLAPLTNAMTTSVPQHEVGIASGLLNLVRNLGGAFGIAIFGTLLTILTKANIYTVAEHSVIHSNAPSAIAQGTALIILKADLLSYGSIFIYASGVMVLGAVMAFLLLSGKVVTEASAEVQAEAMAG
jgi:DHA2 family multidrug resistance protein